MKNSKENYTADYIELSINQNEDNDEPPDQQQNDHPFQHMHKEEARTALLEDNNSSEEDFIIYDNDQEQNQDQNRNSKPKHNEEKSLAFQALPSLIISVIGLVLAGDLLDEFQRWDVFLKTTELFILLPILLNLKGNLEMNLAARFSTSSNLGDLDYGPTRRSLIIGNLSLLQVQSLVAGAIAGVSSFALGLITKPGSNTSYFEMMYMTASAMVSASFSAGILGIFMVALILVCRKFDIDPDNIACPMASSTGDIVTLVLLASCAYILQHQMDTILSTLIFLVMLAMIPFFGLIVWRNKHVKDLLFAGWTPIILAMVISSWAGILLEAFVERYKGVALLTPVLIGLAGNLGSIYASRISTSLHAETKENYKSVELTLILMNIPVQVVFMLIIWAFSLGQLQYNAWFFFSYFLISMICTWICLRIGKYMTLAFWKMGYDPDNYVIPYLTASIDVIGTILLVCCFRILTDSGAADMAIERSPPSH
ncbi:Solute carrier family 41 member 2 [Choanephora cucurbitarum]|uniref:Solute carrier family 41 member 2 n=1 Tax=Choanephora cucurbitarum TaxID=101091 RepID=A0A1C7NEJ5_9FUNG|nr:Solute carrier family 41 member 2 [Choanephora cucurbitarum]